MRSSAAVVRATIASSLDDHRASPSAHVISAIIAEHPSGAHAGLNAFGNDRRWNGMPGSGT